LRGATTRNHFAADWPRLGIDEANVGHRRKRVVAGQVWSIDRRATRRHFLFTPDGAGEVENLFLYCLAVTAAKHGIHVHAFVLMSTHIHMVYTDPQGVQPLFKRDFHRLFACGIKALRGWPEEVFNSSPGGEHEPLGAQALIEAIGYVIANPPECFAVRYAKDWPGAITLPKDLGRRVFRATKPPYFFDPDSDQWPDEAELPIVIHPALEAKYGEEGTRRLISEDVRRRERAALTAAKQRGIAFKGVRRVLRTPHTVRATSHEVFGKVNPRFRAAGDLELARAKIVDNRRFDAEYDRALGQWTAGDRNAVFPYGTWWMRVHHGARVRPPP